jgi:hypothetical protein
VKRHIYDGTLLNVKLVMISGNIAQIENQQETYSDFIEETNGSDLRSCVNVTNTLQTNIGTVKAGIAAEEHYVDRRGLQINGDISIKLKEVKEERWTRYWIADNEYLVVQNKDGRFAYDLIHRITGADVNKISIDISEIIRDYPGQWMGSFGNRSSNVNSGTLYGDDIENDTDLGQAYRNSNKSTIGVKIGYNGDNLMLRIGESWFQIVSPGDYTRKEYLNFFEDVMRNYVK